eukprot:gnl/TRDRNA2_/TRDRNA2_135476_c0_seq1.p1 gnl/TRDRNA2_/TRDRNA2_135476_c0~~gnl/TRDRNA2_/TRDRNA2_135476_c0_seq1.p1  ORF type:complete len:429 (-),score=41.41 gnl/TRDRNA2_/TRDRNA2_135476_c0_seq1:75-1319(-)
MPASATKRVAIDAHGLLQVVPKAVKSLEDATKSSSVLVRRATGPKQRSVDSASLAVDKEVPPAVTSQRLIATAQATGSNSSTLLARPSEVALLGLHPWSIAVLTVVMNSGFVVLGLGLQKRGQASPGMHIRFGDLVLSPEWILGFCLVAFSTIIADYVAYTRAPLSLTTPLAGIGVMLNMVIAPYLLGEQLQLWPDVFAGMFIAVGCTLTSIGGARHEAKFDLGSLEQLCWRPIFLWFLTILIVFLVACLGYMYSKSSEIEQSAKCRPLNPKLLEASLPAFVAAAFGSITKITLKVGFELFKHGGEMGVPPRYAAYCLTFCFIPAALQLNYVNRGLRLYMQTIFVPIYTALQVITNTLYGAVFFEEYTELLANRSHFCIFSVGILLITSGACLFLFRSPKVESTPSIATSSESE